MEWGRPPGLLKFLDNRDRRDIIPRPTSKRIVHFSAILADMAI
jgi:hypothetical protein